MGRSEVNKQVSSAHLLGCRDGKVQSINTNFKLSLTEFIPVTGLHTNSNINSSCVIEIRWTHSGEEQLNTDSETNAMS